ncbi:unnamed protein product [Arctogadus glacialis]
MMVESDLKRRPLLLRRQHPITRTIYWLPHRRPDYTQQANIGIIAQKCATCSDWDDQRLMRRLCASILQGVLSRSEGYPGVPGARGSGKKNSQPVCEVFGKQSMSGDPPIMADLRMDT